MKSCVTCGNVYDKAFQITTDEGDSFWFDSFECAIHRLAPRCAHCGCTVIGHGSESAEGEIFCCAHCAHHAGVSDVQDREPEPLHHQQPDMLPAVPAGVHL